METNREFRKVPSLLFLYEISEDGRYLRNVKSKHYLKPYLQLTHTGTGYYEYHVSIKGNAKHVKAHALVAECWLGPRPNGYVIDHIDHNSHNNHYGNLRYVTQKENIANTSEEGRASTLTAMIEICGKHIKWGDEYFDSYREASRILGERFDKSPETIRRYFKQHRHYILGKHVTYLNAETAY